MPKFYKKVEKIFIPLIIYDICKYLVGDILVEDKEQQWCVYMHRNKINGKVYIGITCKKPEYRWANGKGYLTQPHFARAIEKYGWDGFEHIIIAEELSQEEAKQIEIDLIAQYKSTDRKYGYNMTAGGDGWTGCHHTEEWKEKHREYNRTRIITPEMRKNMSAAQKGKNTGEKNPFYGKEHTEETKRKISKANKGRLAGEKNPFYGKHHSEETKKKLSEMKQGKPGHKHTEEEKKKIGERMLAYQNLPEVKAAKSARAKGENNPMYGKIPVTAKEVSQYTKDGKWIADYPSARHANTETGIDNSSILKCCKGKLKYAGGFIWKYKE